GERAAVHLSDRQLHVAMGATVLERAQAAVGAAEDGDRTAGEAGLNDLAGREPGIVFDRIPVIGMQAGGARLLPQIGRRGERRAPLALRWARWACHGYPALSSRLPPTHHETAFTAQKRRAARAA